MRGKSVLLCARSLAVRVMGMDMLFALCSVRLSVSVVE
jgi:hypothetical protein